MLVLCEVMSQHTTHCIQYKWTWQVVETWQIFLVKLDTELSAAVVCITSAIACSRKNGSVNHWSLKLANQWTPIPNKMPKKRLISSQVTSFQLRVHHCWAYNFACSTSNLIMSSRRNFSKNSVRPPVSRNGVCGTTFISPNFIPRVERGFGATADGYFLNCINTSLMQFLMVPVRYSQGHYSQGPL